MSYNTGDEVKITGSPTGRIWKLTEYKGGGYWQLSHYNLAMVDCEDNFRRVGVANHNEKPQNKKRAKKKARVR